MADISPFRGIRYRPDIPLDDVVAPPYDVLSAAQAAELAGAQPVQRHARRPARASGRGGHRRGLRARGGDVPRLARARERSSATSCPASWSWTRCTRGRTAANAPAGGSSRGSGSPIWTSGSCSRTSARTRAPRWTACGSTAPRTPTSARSSCCSRTTTEPWAATWRRRPPGCPPPHGARPTTATATLHRCAALAGPAAERVAEGLRERPVYIADGHHRYETALAYRDERRALATSAPTRSWSTCAA